MRLFFIVILLPLQALAADKVDFNRDIRPIISENCFACHGPDAKSLKGGLRLDLKDSATKPAKSGAIAAVPGDPAKSELVRRIQLSDEEDDHMPPLKAGHKLTSRQIDLLKRWIQEGAAYSKGWAFIPPQRPELPAVVNISWPRNPIDRFVLAKLESEKLKPSPAADKATLIRRLTLDLTGLPPTPGEVQAFLADPSAHAYERVVDRLLSSPHYGERMALEWLDASRYADTHGYHIDPARDMTHWRDWVIHAFNENQPFDQFTVDQLAGDLLPNATTDQKIASGFNRNHMINFEGGAIAEEYQTAYVIDRVNTTSTIWLGLTLGCAQCHDHKFDPLTQKDYYSMYAFFNSVAEKGLDGSTGNAAPMLQVPSAAQQARLEMLRTAITNANSALKKIESQIPAAQVEWEKKISGEPLMADPPGLAFEFALDESLEGVDADKKLVPSIWNGEDKPKWVAGRIEKALKLEGITNQFVSINLPSAGFDSTNAFSYGCWIRQAGKEGAIIAKIDESENLRGFDLYLQGDKVFAHLINSWPGNAIRVMSKNSIPRDQWIHLMATYDGSKKAAGLKIYVDGVETALEIKEDKLSGSITNATPLNLGRRSKSAPLTASLDDVRIYERALAPQEVSSLAEGPILLLARHPKGNRSDADEKDLARYFKAHSQSWIDASATDANAHSAFDAFNKTIPTTMVMSELAKPRESFLLLRGQYDQKGEKVTPATPAALPPMDPDLPRNRLGLARWLVSTNHPLMARVTVNRFWQMYFGNGIVKTVEDFGSQSDWPSHPQLLDWLATEFMRGGWNVKALQKLIVMSATYQQSSVIPKELVASDPENRLLARGPRFRLPAELIRDEALAVSGLLNTEIGGESVNPYQPPGLWEELMVRADGDKFTAQKYVQSHGRALYRRSMYTFWKRSSPPASMAVLDAPDRQTCVVRRQRTNTPLQSLVLMDDPTYMEAARRLAERLMWEAKNDPARVDMAFQWVLARHPNPKELSLLLNLYREQRLAYLVVPDAATNLLKVGESDHDNHMDPADLAAWTMVATTILNLDEAVTSN